MPDENPQQPTYELDAEGNAIEVTPGTQGASSGGAPTGGYPTASGAGTDPATDPNNPDNTSTTADGNDELADIPAESLPGAGSDSGPMPEEVTADRVVTIQALGIGPRDPYPTGNPPDPFASKNSGPNQFGATPLNEETIPRGAQPPGGDPRSEPLIGDHVGADEPRQDELDNV